MKLTRALNLQITLDAEDGGKIHVHSTPIGREVYEQFYWVLAQTFSSLFSSGMREIGGPSAAYLMLREFAQKSKQWEEVKAGLINEIVRLSNVAFVGKQGWEMLPLYTAFERGMFDEDDRAEIEGQLVFFTLMARVASRRLGPLMQGLANDLWGSASTASDFTAFLSSLRTSTGGATTSPTPPEPPAPAPPSSAPARTASVPH